MFLLGKKITDKVTWVGKIDWELTEFHGHEYSTEKGSSYNSYLIRDQKTVLMDTVWKPFDEEFVASLKREIDLKDIDYIVMNHNENDHSGALPALMREIPDTPIYCTKKGKPFSGGCTIRTGTTLPSRPATPWIWAAASWYSSKLPCSTGRIPCSPT